MAHTDVSSRACSSSAKRCLLPALTCALASACFTPPAASAAPSGLAVVPHPAAGAPGLSYFKLKGTPGHAVPAGTIELNNTTRRALRVLLVPVDGQTLGTLGSSYASPGSKPHGSTRWLALGARAVTLPPGQGAVVPVQVLVPATARPGDYLAGLSVEAQHQRAGTAHKGVSIASVVRYAIGVEVSLPGPRHPLIQFTGARLERQPSGLAFLLLARNRGNAILQNVRGAALITRGKRVVARAPLGPGTFVTRSSIEYPILAPRERPSAGTVYRVRAYLRYAGGIARLDTLVRFGRRDARIQQEYSKHKAGGASGLPGWVAGLLGAFGCVLAVGAPVRRGRGAPRRARSPLRALDAAAKASREQGTPFGLIVLSTPGSHVATSARSRLLRQRLRHADRLTVLADHRFLVVAPDTDLETARALGEDLRRHLERANGDSATVAVEVQEGDPHASAAELLARIDAPANESRLATPSG
jgi:hypothetical protein